tara:strand:- start:625 stop:1245 length:621 start_codon:yes stop_codon:yes gene_type:complete
MAKETLRQYLNRKIKDKGSSLTAEKKKAGKYKSISAAKKAGSLYYTDKNNKVMAAVFANDLKEKTKDTAVKTSKRPKIRRRGFSVPSVTVTLLPDKYMDEKPRSSDRGKANRTISRKRKPGGPDPSGVMTPGGRKTYVPVSKTKKTSGKLSKLKGINWMKAHTYADYMALSKSEARALGLPATRLASTQHKLRNQKFKDGKNFMGK